MRFQEIWDQLCRKKPELSKTDATVEFRSSNLQALLRQVYEQGQKHPERDSGSMFDNIFSGL